MAEKDTPLWDVIIYEYATGVVDSVAGKNMQRSVGYYNAEKRLETVLPRLNDRYGAKIVPAGRASPRGISLWR